MLLILLPSSGSSVLKRCELRSVIAWLQHGHDVACEGCNIKASCICSYVLKPLAPSLFGDSCLECSYVWRDGQHWQVPASRADVFRDTSLKPPEKRLLMRFLQKLQQYATQDGSKV